MVLPLSDAPNPRGVPWVTYALIVINVAVYLLLTLPLSQQAASLQDPALREYLMMLRDRLPMGVSLEEAIRATSAYDLFVFNHGFRPGAPEGADLLTSLFLHGGFMHLFGNMLFLWIYGDNVEHRLGRGPFLLGYVLTGIAATLFFALFARGSQVPLVGASGAISGVLGFYFLWFPRNTVRLFVFLFPIFVNVVPVPARLVLGIYLVLDNLVPFLFTASGEGGIAHGAHLGGFIAGLIAARILDQRQVNRTPRDYRTPIERTPPSIRDALHRALEEGRHNDAARLYFTVPAPDSRRLLEPGPSLDLADWLAHHDHPDAALTVYQRHLRDYPRGPGLAEAHLGAARVQLDGRGQAAPAYQHLLDALDADPSPAVEARIRTELTRIADLQKYRLRRFS